MSFPGSEDVIRFLADEELAGSIVRRRFGAAGQAEILSGANRAEMTDVEQMKKIVPFATCEITFGQYVCELMFGVNVANLNLGV